MITVSPRRGRSFDGYLQLFHWTELIQSSPLAVERSVYEVVGGAYRKQQRDDHGAALQPHEAQPGRRAGPRPHHQRRHPGHGPGEARVPRHAGPHPVPRPGVPVPAQRDHRREGHRLPGRGVVGIDIAGPGVAGLPARGLPAPVRAGAPQGPGHHGPHRRIGAGRGDRARSSGSSSRRASATASRPPSTRARWP